MSVANIIIIVVVAVVAAAGKTSLEQVRAMVQQESEASQAVFCYDRYGRQVADGEVFIPGDDACHKCHCVHGVGAVCTLVRCSPPNCVLWEAVPDECCQFNCIQTSLGSPFPSNTSNLPGTIGSDDIDVASISIRLAGTAVSSLLIIVLFLFMIQRLRRKRLIIRRFSHEQNSEEQIIGRTVSSEQFDGCAFEFPLYDDPPPPYSMQKPIVESPPPYEQAQQAAMVDLSVTNGNHASQQHFVELRSERTPVVLPFGRQAKYGDRKLLNEPCRRSVGGLMNMEGNNLWRYSQRMELVRFLSGDNRNFVAESVEMRDLSTATDRTAEGDEAVALSSVIRKQRYRYKCRHGRYRDYRHSAMVDGRWPVRDTSAEEDIDDSLDSIDFTELGHLHRPGHNTPPLASSSPIRGPSHRNRTKCRHSRHHSDYGMLASAVGTECSSTRECCHYSTAITAGYRDDIMQRSAPEADAYWNAPSGKPKFRIDTAAVIVGLSAAKTKTGNSADSNVENSCSLLLPLPKHDAGLEISSENLPLMSDRCTEGYQTRVPSTSLYGLDPSIYMETEKSKLNDKLPNKPPEYSGHNGMVNKDINHQCDGKVLKDTHNDVECHWVDMVNTDIASETCRAVGSEAESGDQRRSGRRCRKSTASAPWRVEEASRAISQMEMEAAGDEVSFPVDEAVTNPMSFGTSKLRITENKMVQYLFSPKEARRMKLINCQETETFAQLVDDAVEQISTGKVERELVQPVVHNRSTCCRSIPPGESSTENTSTSTSCRIDPRKTNSKSQTKVNLQPTSGDNSSYCEVNSPANDGRESIGSCPMESHGMRHYRHKRRSFDDKIDNVISRATLQPTGSQFRDRRLHSYPLPDSDNLDLDLINSNINSLDNDIMISIVL